MLTALAVVVKDKAHAVIAGVVVLVKTGIVELVGITNNDGYVVFDAVSMPLDGTLQLTGPCDYYEQPISINAENVTLRVGGTQDNPQDVLLPPATRSFKLAPISKEQFRALPLKGNFGGMVLPGWGLSKHDVLFDPMIPWYPQATQDAILAAKKTRGLNVINLCSWADYHGSEFDMPISYDWVNNPQAAADYCKMLRKRGFIPAFWLLGDRVAGDVYDEYGRGCDGALGLIARMLPAIKDVVGCVSPGYELRGPGMDNAPYSAAQYRRMLILMNALAPNLYKFGHFVSENSAGSSHSPVEQGDPWKGDEIDFWVKTAWADGSSLLDGIFYQAPVEGKLFDGNAWEDRWQEMIDRIGAGNHIWPPPCTNVDLAWGEAGWYDITRGSRTEAQLQTVSSRALVLGGRWSFSG